jgi:BirA family biotin operon repressor/biotin-[acetyl-CoA-carboxylase] ligase
MTRTAISPLFAISTLENTTYLRLMPFERAKAALSGSRFADLRWVESTGSTNADVARILLERGPGDPRTPVVLIAGHQSAGRGRRDRTWEAPPGASLLMTIGLSVAEVAPERWSLINAALALAAVDAAPSLRIKWPNDLVAPGAGLRGADLKVAGLLSEIHPAVSGAGPWLVAGLGMNLNWTEMPAALATTATSLDIVLGGAVDPEMLVTDLLVSLDSRWLGLIERPTPATEELLDAYRSRSATIGRQVSVELDATSGGDALLVGTAVDIDATGALVVESAKGSRRTVTVGDVVHLRPTD